MTAHRRERTVARGGWRSVAMAAGLALTLAAPSPAATLYGLIDTGELFASADNGANWSPLATLPVSDAVGLAARLSSSDLFLLSRSGSVHRSVDAGVNWAAVGAITANDFEDLAIRPDGTLLALTASGSLFASADQGASFTGLATLTASNCVSLCSTTPLVGHYALTRTGEVYESLDGGASWSPQGVFTVSNAIRLRAVQSVLYALTETGDIFRSTDAAASWTAVSTLSQVGMRGLVRNGTALAAASREGHLATSADGLAWTWQGSMNQLTLTALATNEPATTGVEPAPAGGLFLGPPFPNPSSGAATFTLRVERDADVRLALYDIGGRLAASRAVQRFAAGSHPVTWDPGVRSAGLYFLRVEGAGGGAATRRWVMVR